MIDYHLNDQGIFCVVFSETVTSIDIKKYLSDFEKIKDIPKDFLALYDLRDVHLNLKIMEIVAISKLAKKVTSSYRTIRTALLVDKPNITAYSILFTRESSHNKSKRKVFSTTDAATKWLLLEHKVLKS